MDPKKMRKIGITVNICMGVTMSFFLSLIGTGMSGHFTVPSWLVSFLISTAVSLIIGFVVPMKRVTEGASRGLKLKPHSLTARCVESLVSDFIYTPVMTFIMVFYAYKSAISHGAPAESMNFGRMFLGSFGIGMAAGFLLAFIFMPLYVKMAMKKNGIDPGQGGPNPRGPVNEKPGDGKNR